MYGVTKGQDTDPTHPSGLQTSTVLPHETFMSSGPGLAQPMVSRFSVLQATKAGNNKILISISHA